MSEMVERVARAIYEMRSKPWSLLPRSHKEPYLADAAAVLKAMREPTEAMVLAAKHCDNGDDHYLGQLAGREIWQAMIDEAMR